MTPGSVVRSITATHGSAVGHITDLSLRAWFAIHGTLLSDLLIFIAYIANNMNPDQTAPLRSSLIRVHGVCMHGKSSLNFI